MTRRRARRVRRANVETVSGLRSAAAACRDCQWGVASRNAMAVAKQHAQRYAHTVDVEQTIDVTYRPELP